MDKNEQKVAEGTSDVDGKWKVELLDYAFMNGNMTRTNIYVVKSGSSSEKVLLDENKSIMMKSKGKMEE